MLNVRAIAETRMHRLSTSLVAICCVLLPLDTSSQVQSRNRAHWLMDGGDPQRTSWQRNETLISPSTVGSMKLMWKLKLDNQPRQMHNIFAPLIIGDLQTSSGPREVAIVA